MIKCFFKGHSINRPNIEFKRPICIECGKNISDKEMMDLYEKELRRHNLEWLKGRCKSHFELNCPCFGCRYL